MSIVVSPEQQKSAPARPRIEAHDLPIIYNAFRDRHRDRDFRTRIIDAVVAGDWAVVDPSNEKLVSRSPNLVQVALEDTAEAAGTMPTVRVIPRRGTDRLKKVTGRMEKIANGYFDNSQMDLLIMQTVLDMAAFGFCPWVIWPDYESRLPIIEKRDPRFCYPEPGYRPGVKVQRCMFTRQMHFSQLPDEYRGQILDYVLDDKGNYIEERLRINLMEFFTEDEYIIAALFQGNQQDVMSYPGYGIAPGPVYTPVILDRWDNPTGVCPVVIGSRFTLDGQFRGQFDQIVGPMEAHVRLMGMVLDYADQAVYSDIWVKDLIGELSWGGGAYIELGPNGAIGRVPPAVTSLNVGQDLDRLVEGIHVGGRWPKSRPGEVDQAIASAKFVEATAGIMNTAIKTYHQILQRMMEHSVRLCFKVDQVYFPGQKTISGVLRNQEFVEEYNTETDIDLNNRIRIEYGLGLGRDPAQSAVLMLQYQQQGYISQEFVQENIEGLTDVGRERVRLDVEKFQGMVFAKLLQGIQDGSIPNDALLAIMQGRENGEDLAILFKKYIVEPGHGVPGVPAGAAGAPGLPGAGGPPPPGGAQPPGPLSGPEGGAPIGPPGLSPPPPPAADQMMMRLTAPAGGPGSFIRAYRRMSDNVSVNRPSSGTYGEAADLQRLKQSLPQGAIGNPAPPTQGNAPAGPPPKPALPQVQPPGRPDTGGAPAPPGIPSVLLGPTQRPGVPVSTPLAGPPQPSPAVTPAQGRLQLLYMLAGSPDVDPTTREWAQVVIEKLLGPGAANTPTLGQPPSPAPGMTPPVGRG